MQSNLLPYRRTIHPQVKTTMFSLRLFLALLVTLAALVTAAPTRSPVFLSHMRRDDWDAAPRSVKVLEQAARPRPRASARALTARASMGRRSAGWKSRVNDVLSDYEPAA